MPYVGTLIDRPSTISDFILIRALFWNVDFFHYFRTMFRLILKFVTYFQKALLYNISLVSGNIKLLPLSLSLSLTLSLSDWPFDLFLFYRVFNDERLYRSPTLWEAWRDLALLWQHVQMYQISLTDLILINHLFVLYLRGINTHNFQLEAFILLSPKWRLIFQQVLKI